MGEDNSTLRRALAALAAFSAPFIGGFLKSKLGIDVSTESVVGFEVAAAVYMVQSVINAIHARGVAAKAAPTPAAAVNDLAKGPA